MGIPCKTAAGHAELASPSCRLSRRHRALLLLVDGDHSLDEVKRLGRQAGVPRSYLDELFAQGLIVIGPPVSPPLSDFLNEFGLPPPPPCGPTDFGLTSPGVVGHAELARLDVLDTDFAQARNTLLQMLRAHAPVTGMVTMLRVRRVRSRAELRALLPEVQARLSRSQPPAEARQLLLRIESLLTTC